MSKIKYILLSIVATLLSAESALASSHRGTAPGSTGGGSLENPLGNTTIIGLLTRVLDVVVQISLPIIVLFLVYAGFLFISAQGNEDKLNTAKKVFLWTIIGAVIILGSSVLLHAIQGTVDQLTKGVF
tara:strand:- start:120 stop:503 length:384 start_codon:yes stop_codon:yes gene_type:complete